MLMSYFMNCSSIESSNPVQEKFTQIVEDAMITFKEGKIMDNVKALQISMYYSATA